MTDTRVHRFGPTTRRPRRASSLAASAAVAVLAAGALAGCGDDTGDATASDGSSSSATASTSASPTESGSASASPSDTATPTTAPTVAPLDPLVVQAVAGALDDRFPALIPTEVPAGWTVTAATYEKQAWSIELTDAAGSPVTLTQRESDLDALVATTVGDGAQKTGKVDLKDAGLGTWGVYEAGGAVGIARELAGTAVVVTAVDAPTATALAETLLTAEDADMPEAG